MATFGPNKPLSCVVKFGTQHYCGDLSGSAWTAFPSVSDGKPSIKIMVSAARHKCILEFPLAKSASLVVENIQNIAWEGSSFSDEWEKLAEDATRSVFLPESQSRLDHKGNIRQYRLLIVNLEDVATRYRTPRFLSIGNGNPSVSEEEFRRKAPQATEFLDRLALKDTFSIICLTWSPAVDNILQDFTRVVKGHPIKTFSPATTAPTVEEAPNVSKKRRAEDVDVGSEVAHVNAVAEVRRKKAALVRASKRPRLLLGMLHSHDEFNTPAIRDEMVRYQTQHEELMAALAEVVAAEDAEQGLRPS